MKNIVILLLIFTAHSVFATGTDSTQKTSTLPSVVLKNTNGESVDIQTYGNNGKITIISFWATWCKPCIKELRNINDLLEDWADDYNAELVAVSVDDSRNSTRVKPFASGQGWNFDILLDPNGELQRALNVTNPPLTILLDSTGNIIYTHTGYLEGDEYDLEEEIKKAAGKTTSTDTDKKDKAKKKKN